MWPYIVVVSGGAGPESGETMVYTMWYILYIVYTDIYHIVYTDIYHIVYTDIYHIVYTMLTGEI
jgi:hypothetical protein